MATGPTGVSRLDVPALLSRATLKLASDLRVTPTRGNLVAIHNPSDRRYLVLAQTQWALLQRFQEATTVPHLLCEIISENHCPPLREFYELVVKGYQHSVLLVQGQPPPAYTKPSKWNFSLPTQGTLFTSISLLGVALTIVLFTRVQMPTNLVQVIVGTLGALAAGSIGNFLAAGVLRGAGCLIYRPRFEWKNLAPRFRVALEEAIMGGRETEVTVAVVRLVPPFVLAAAAALKAPHYYLPLLIGLLIELSPLWHTPLLDLLRTWLRDPRHSTRTRFVFAANHPFAVLAQARQQFSERAFLAAGTGAAILWLAGVFVTGCVLFQANAVDLVHRFYDAGGLRLTGLVVVCTLAALVLGITGLILWILLGHAVAWVRGRQARRRRLEITGKSPGQVAEMLRSIVLFRDLPPEAVLDVAVAMKPMEFAKGAFVIRVGEEADRLYVIVSGRLEVIRHFDDGKSGAVAEMFPGDVLGEIAVVQGGTRTRSIRCATPSILLALSKADFERLVLTHVTRAAVVDAVQKVGFLQNIDLVKNWPQQSLAAFARLATIQEYNEGDLVVREGTENLYLFLVHRGEFAITRNNKVLRKLRQGDSYGEIGILQNRESSTNVVATMPGSCLVIGKDDFLKFITQDFTITLQFEELGSKRLGKKLFGSHNPPGFDPMRA